jgi:hypothetical protein
MGGHGNILICSMIIGSISMAVLSLDPQIEDCYSSFFALSASEIREDISRLRCTIPHDECRCSITSNKFNSSRNCISDIQAMSGPILVPLSFVLQIYLIYELLSLIGKLSRTLRDLFLGGALLVYIISAFTMQRNSCLYFYTSETAIHSGFFLFVVVVYLIVHSGIKYPTHIYFRASKYKELVEQNHKCEIPLYLLSVDSEII